MDLRGTKSVLIYGFWQSLGMWVVLLCGFAFLSHTIKQLFNVGRVAIRGRSRRAGTGGGVAHGYSRSAFQAELSSAIRLAIGALKWRTARAKPALGLQRLYTIYIDA